MIRLPKLRLPWRRRTPVTRPVAVAEPPVAVPAPAWTHKPPEPVQAAVKCGQCGEKIPDRAMSLEFCGAPCQAKWISAFTAWLNAEAKWLRDGDMNPVHTCQPPAVIGPRAVPELPPEPEWLAALTDWDRAKAQRLVAERKAAAEKEEAA